MKTWIIRHHDLSLERPIPELELIQKIESGEVLASDELAHETGYWFSIQEVEEVKRFFGEHIKLQSMIPTSAETTSSTNTALLHERAKQNNRVYTQTAFKQKTPAAKIEKTVQVPKKVEATDVQPRRARIVFGAFLILIFCGTLLGLWLSSQ